MVQYPRNRVRQIDEAFRIEPLKIEKKVFPRESVPIQDAFNVGVYFVTPLLAGTTIGYMLDNKLGTKPTGFVFGLLFGFIGSLFNLIKFVRTYTKHA